MRNRRPYTVYFTIGDKRMKMRVNALHAAHAQQQVRDKLQVLKVVEEPASGDDDFKKVMDMLDDAMDMLGGTKKPKKN
jgi:hypothetical protein